jgi:hypothetical protein
LFYLLGIKLRSFSDANASCSLNGMDFIFMVRNFRMDPTGAIPCPLCPGNHVILKNRDDIPLQAK